ncbi:MAG: sigma 54-dependent Fis family transcriptional regulator [Myxococcales bacterium]|nr:sigma 54-dependent Fis family transcriptional regulator [Myxococcales bacterium]MCB9522400.1 sigma 54-dependent Fis family transcriptional regulator [Myxococcales bacterium]
MSQDHPNSIESLPPERDAIDEREHTVEVRVGETGAIQIEKCELVVMDGPDQGKTLVLDKSIVRIGTNEKNDLVLVDNTVSRFHCEIRLVGDEYLLVDRSSTNGTWVGQLRVGEAALYPDVEIMVGNTTVRFAPLIEHLEVVPFRGSRYGDMVGGATRMREVYGILDKVAPSELSVVVEGETGTGKELVARAIHQHSRRREGPLVIFDCSAFPENLLESELFGHEKGAFSGAHRTHKGVFERAEGGTVFFDELGEMSLALQPKFLRALESGEVRRVGGERTIKTDVRVVAATNRDLAVMVDEGRFRRDLYYRLAKVRLQLPALRDRVEDLDLLAHFFLEALRQRGGRLLARSFSADALELMRAYDWPGNVRELRNVVERAAAFCENDQIEVDDLPSDLQARLGRPAHRSPVAAAGADLEPGTGLKEAKELMVSRFEREYLLTLLERHDQNISQVAREAGIDRRHVYRLMKKHDIELPDR